MLSGMATPSVKPKPFLKWAGGKSRLSSIIKSYFPSDKEFNKYYEPFLGSGAVYFEISPQKGQLNDLNKFLIGAYTDIRDSVEPLIAELNKIDREYHSLQTLEKKAKYYYEKREEYNADEILCIRKSALFIFLNKAGFNGMYRENSSGKYNIPFGKHDKCLICDKNNLRAVSRDLKEIVLTALDYKDAVKSAKKGDLIYFDPPYFPVSETASFTTYQKGGFNDDEQAKLCDIAKELVERGCFVAISNSDCPKSRALYKNMNISEIKVRRIINSNSRKRGEVTEILATSYPPKRRPANAS